jgi:hypothetical protein
MRSIRLWIYALCALIAIGVAPALSAYNVPRNTPLVYFAEISQRFRNSLPWTGDLVIKVDDEGLVSGQYRSTSIRPDPFRGSTALINGAVNGEFIRINFNASGRPSVRGTVSEDRIVGTFYDAANRLFDFNAVRVSRE